MLTPTSRLARAVISAMLTFGPAGGAGWAAAVAAEPVCGAAAGFGGVGDCAVWAAALAMPSNRTATKARAISRNRSIIGCPLPGDPLSRRLTVDGVDNKANGTICRLSGMGGWLSLMVFLASFRVPSGLSRKHVGRRRRTRLLAREPRAIVRRRVIDRRALG